MLAIVVPVVRTFEEVGWKKVLDFIEAHQLSDRVEPSILSILGDYRITRMPTLIVINEEDISEVLQPQTQSMEEFEIKTPKRLLNEDRDDWVIGKLRENLKLNP